MKATTKKFAARGCAASLFFLAALVSAQQGSFDGSWEMDSAKSHMNDARVVTLNIVTVGDSLKMIIKTRKSDGHEATSEFTSKFDGKACEFAEGTHKSHVMVWYNGPSLNASKENGPAEDVTSMWKFELAPDKQTMTMKISHYEPASADETLAFIKKTS